MENLKGIESRSLVSGLDKEKMLKGIRIKCLTNSNNIKTINITVFKSGSLFFEESTQFITIIIVSYYLQ